MNFFLICLPLILIKKMLNEYHKIELKNSDSYYFITLNINHFTNNTNFIFSNYIPISFIPTLECKICTKFKLNENNSNLVSIRQNINIPYYHYNYTGDLYQNIISLDNLIAETDFIGFKKITYINEFSHNGIFSLSYLNYNFNTTKQLFALEFDDDDCELHLGGYDNNTYNYSELKAYNVVVDEKNSIDEILNKFWYIKFSSVLINNKPLNSNLTSDIKLTFDMGTEKFHIPKKFFFENINLIFPPRSHCQMNPKGYFSCECNENYLFNFGNFLFNNSKNQTFIISTEDYISKGISESKCKVNIKVNYENDLFIAGVEILKKYYSIFDIENKIFLVSKKKETQENMEYLVLLLILLSFIDILIFGIFICYKKCKRTNIDEEYDEIVEAINPQAESSEETD